jgi:hypothetical protein
VVDVLAAAAIVISILTFAPMTPIQASQLNSNYVEYKLSAIKLRKKIKRESDSFC